jgi:hypothetical protein
MSKRATYDRKVQQSSPRFSILAAIARHLGIKSGAIVHLTITKGKRVLFRGWHELKSGLEIYGPQIRASVKTGQLIHVVVHT